MMALPSWSEAKAMIEKTLEDHPGYYIGLRLAETEHQVGDHLVGQRSRHNPERKHFRDFPEFGSPEYETLPELNGLSAWHIRGEDDEAGWTRTTRGLYQTQKVYLMASGLQATHNDSDDDEIVLVDPIVIGAWVV